MGKRRSALGALCLLGALGCSGPEDSGANDGGNGGTAGTAGTAGDAGTAGTGAEGGTSGGNTCDGGEVGPLLGVSTIGPSGPATAEPFVGPATVERSVEGELTLAFVWPDADGEPAHAVVRGIDPGLRFAPGTKLWLSKHPAVEAPFSFQVQNPPWSISVRDREDGTLLLGAASNDFESPASPVRIGEVTPICTATNVNPSGCTPGASVRYSSVTIAGDDPVVVEHGEPGVIGLGGVAYDVRLAAQQETAGTVTCADYAASGGVKLDVRARELEELVTTLEIGPPPECGLGNDADPTLFFGLTEVSVSTAHEGEVTYKGRDPMSPDTYQFDVPGLPSLTGTPPTFYINGAAALLPEPAVGPRFWLAFPGLGAQALRESEQGPVLLAQVFGGSGRDALGQLSSLIGVPVTQEERCAYTSSSSLWDVVFETTPPARVQSGATETVVIDGRPYRVWARSQGEPMITVYPAD